jgi:hypothetical protein
MSFEETVEALIKEAQARGDFDNLTSKGKPIDLTDYFNTPEDLRVTQSLLKNAGMVPLEVELLREIAALKDKLNSTITNVEKTKLQKLLKDKQLQFDLLLERRRK